MEWLRRQSAHPSGSVFILLRWFAGHSNRVVTGLLNPRQALCISEFRYSTCAGPESGRYSGGIKLIKSLFMFLQSVSFPPPAFFWT